ncbi:T9SS type A sorting domain-containing protein [Cytophagaceae bacterium ABcell3]|nr:T9SS type A sorting domain-containing protein [Cytophagaceae bacterium ABcell3]
MKLRLAAKQLLFLAAITLLVTVQELSFAQNLSFNIDTLSNANVINPTSLQFGPDGKLYVSQQNGIIKILTIKRNGPGDYETENVEDLFLVRHIPNHYDDGSPRDYNINTNNRQVTGILVKGTPDNPILYVTSSDPWHGGGAAGDRNLCTNSGVISKLYKDGGQWKKVDLVRGIPRSEENHSINGLQMATLNGKDILFVAVGGMTNAGGISRTFVYSSEYALAACILSVDLEAIEAMPLKGQDSNHPYKYDLPTLDDPTRENRADGSDINDPWGGNDGLNMAKIEEGGPVQVYATGLRNPYDLVITENGNMYTVDNAANRLWGGYPDLDENNKAINRYNPDEPGSAPATTPSGQPVVNNHDPLQFIGNIETYTPGTFYGGHPHPIRANPAGAGLYTHDWHKQEGFWRTSISGDKPLPTDWPPFPESLTTNENLFLNPGEGDHPALIVFKTSTNGICEYTATNFNGAMQGNLLTVGYNNGNVYRVMLNAQGDQALNTTWDSPFDGKYRKEIDENDRDNIIFGLGANSRPLDITAQGDGDIFPGTIWVANYNGHASGNNQIMVFEPEENFVCTNEYSWTMDDDNDCYSNADEEDNRTNPCSAASRPSDFDNDCLSDLNDPDDDSDGILDINDAFARDKHNGDTTRIPLNYTMFNNNPGTGFFGLGFTGLMINNETDYLEQFNPRNLIPGGAPGVFTIVDVSEGDALGDRNNQENAFQFGISVNKSTEKFTVDSWIMRPFFGGISPSGHMSQGIFIGTGDQDNYLKIALNANEGNGGIEIVHENEGMYELKQLDIEFYPENTVFFYLEIEPSTGLVQPAYAIDDSTNIANAGDPIQLKGKTLEALQSDQSLATGVIATSRGADRTFGASWDNFRVRKGNITGTKPLVLNNKTFTVYPNPFNNSFKIKTDASTLDPGYHFVIYNNIGSIIQQQDLILNYNQDMTFNLNNQPAGIYILKLVSPGGEVYQSTKLIKIE